MIPLIFAHQTITVFSKLDTIIITGLLLILPLIIIESLIIKKYSKRTWKKLFKFCIIINLVASLTALLFFIFSNLFPKVITGIFIWFFLPIVIIVIENIIYQRRWKVIRKIRLLLALAFITLVSYLICTIVISGIITSAVRSQYTNRLCCTNNLKQIGIGLIMYADDYNNFLPEKSGAEGLNKLCANYFNHNKYVFVCPSTNNKKGKKKQKLSEKNLDYIYRGGFKISADKNIDYSKIPVAWDKPTNHENYGNVLFLDGQVKGFEGKDWMEQAGIKKTTTPQGK